VIELVAGVERGHEWGSDSSEGSTPDVQFDHMHDP
jgi:hypothetical protein